MLSRGSWTTVDIARISEGFCPSHSVGLLLVVDPHVDVLKRTWSSWDLLLALEERNKGKSFLLDVAATDQSAVAHLIIDGLAAEEQKMIPLLGLLTKMQREGQFPPDMLMKCVNFDFLRDDKYRILAGIAIPGREWGQPAERTRRNAASRALAAVFSLPNQFSSLARGYNTSRLLQGLQDGESLFVESVMQRLEQELWAKEDYELPAFILDYKYRLQGFAVQDIDRKIGELRASQSKKAGVSMRYLLSQELLTLPMDISTFRDGELTKKTT